jgi:hypothetical protein
MNIFQGVRELGWGKNYNFILVVWVLLGNSPASGLNNQTPGNYPEESIQHSQHGESLKSRTLHSLNFN